MRVQTRETIKTITELRPSQISDKTSCSWVTISVISAVNWPMRGSRQSEALLLWSRAYGDAVWNVGLVIPVLKCDVWINIFRDGRIVNVTLRLAYCDYCNVTPCNTFRTWLVLHVDLWLEISCDKLKPQQPGRDVRMWVSESFVLSVESHDVMSGVPGDGPRTSHLTSQHPLTQTHSR